MKKNITSEEIKVNNFNKLVIASRNEFKDSELSSPKFSKNSIKISSKSRTVSRDQRLQKFFERSSSNRSLANKDHNIEFDESNKRSKSVIKNNFNFTNDNIANTYNEVMKNELTNVNISKQKSETQINKVIQNPYDFENGTSNVKGRDFRIKSKIPSRSLFKQRSHISLNKKQNIYPLNNLYLPSGGFENASSISMLEKHINDLVNIKMKCKGGIYPNLITGYGES